MTPRHPRRAGLVAVTSAALALGASGAGAQMPGPGPPGASTGAPRGMTRGRAAGLATLELRLGPAGVAGAGARLPMIVALHAWGGGPRGLAMKLAHGDFPCRARLVAIRGPRSEGTGYAWTERLAEDPDQAGLAAELRGVAGQVARAIAELGALRPTVGTPVLTGFSQGATVTFAVAALHPERLAAAFPVAGLLPRLLWPGETADLPPPNRRVPIIALHGADDAIVPIRRARATVDRLALAGVPARLEAIPAVGHRFHRRVRDRLQAHLAREVCVD